MIQRELKKKLADLLSHNPAVVLTGPRQVGKTTLALDIAGRDNAVYLDLESPRDIAKVSDVEYFCEINADKLLIFDEIQRLPDLFSPLRSIIDRNKREGRRNRQFLLLGSASLDLLKQSSESLAGRVAYAELPSLTVTETTPAAADRLWLRGGFPESFLSVDDSASLQWRENFITTYLERDIPQLGPRIPAETLRRFWTMLAHNQGQLFNSSSLARGLDVKSVTTSRYLDLMVDLLLVRRLKAWTSNLGRRLVKAPKTYIRDSGICHALLGIETMNDLLGHPVAGGSWEGLVIENLLGCLPTHVNFGYYRTSRGAEIDLVIQTNRGALFAIEIKRSTAPTVSKGFHSGCEDLQPTHRFVVSPGNESYPLSKEIMVLSIVDAVEKISETVS